MNPYNIWWIFLSAKNLKSNNKTLLRKLGFNKWINGQYLRHCNGLQSARDIQSQINFPHIALFVTDKQFGQIKVKN